jgi:ribulose-5-phosphate 4-epimerase/fuculose-1-phosphate aldolase
MSLTQDLVIAYRVLADYGVIDGYGHVSVRSPNDPGRYLMSRSLAPELVTEADLMEFDLDSTPIDPQPRLAYRERFIHGEIYKLRPEVNAIVHNHSPSVIPFGVTATPAKPVFHMAAFVGRGVPLFEIRKHQKGTNLLVESAKLGVALAKTIGDKPAALMRGHGAVVVGEDLPRAVGRSIYLEVNSQLQLNAMAIAGRRGKITYLDKAEVQASAPAQDYGRAWNLWRNRGLALLRADR